MRYELLSANTLKDLNKDVTDHLMDGWKLYGNPYSFVASGSGTHYFFQAVVYTNGNDPICCG